MAQLKMYWLTDSPFEEFTLPEGYSFSHYRDETDIPKWAACIWEDHDGDIDNERYQREIIDFKDIVPEEDMWFIDYNGEHIGTATSFIFSETGIGDMHWVGIRKDFRGRGLAKYLSNIVQKTLRDRGAKIISLTTGEGRPAAVKSYLTAGFLPVEYDVGMQERWENVLDMFGLESVQMLNDDATPYKVIYRKKHN